MGLVQLVADLRVLHAGRADAAQRGVEVPADVVDPGHGVPLRQRSLPLVEIPTVVLVGGPGAAPHRHPSVCAETVQILGDEYRPHRRAAGADLVERLPIEDVPEIGLFVDVSEPPAVVAIGGGGHQRREIAPFRPFVDLVTEPVVLHARKLGGGQLAVPDDNDHFLAFILGDVRTVADFLPGHVVDGIDVLAINQHVAITGPLQVRNQLHVETHFRRPEAAEMFPPEHVAGDPEPAGDLLVPIRLGDQRQDRMVVAGADNLEQAAVL